MFRQAVLASALCALATAAAVVSFTRGAWVGGVWVLLAGLSSNLAWYYACRARARKVNPAGTCGTGGACGGCVQKACR